MRDPLINALHRMDKNFFELMTPVDAVSMLDSLQAAQEISEQQLHARQVLEGVLALDPKNLDLIGKSYFDMGILREDKEVRAFEKIAYESYNSTNVAVNKKWFKFIRTLSKPHLPDYASS